MTKKFTDEMFEVGRMVIYDNASYMIVAHKKTILHNHPYLLIVKIKSFMYSVYQVEEHKIFDLELLSPAKILVIHNYDMLSEYEKAIRSIDKKIELKLKRDKK
jgi:hypothetical protein